MRRIGITDIAKNGIWLTFPPLLLSLSFMSHLPAALTPALFNKDIPDVLVNGESIVRILVFAMPAFFSIGLSTKSQKRGVVLYLVGVALYYLSYGALIIFPGSAWSTSMIGFVATAYTNLFWMIGLGVLGETFYFQARLRYRPVMFIAPAAIFLILHITHAIIVYQRSF
jgi:hypothetical protein